MYHTAKAPIVGTPRDLCITPDYEASRSYVASGGITYTGELADGIYTNG